MTPKLQPLYNIPGERLVSSPSQFSSSPPPISISVSQPSHSIAEAISPLRKAHRLSGNTNLRALDMDELEPLPPSEASQASSSKLASRSQPIEIRQVKRLSSNSSEYSSQSNGHVSARYVTVSSVLSRSGAAIPISQVTIGPHNNSMGNMHLQKRSVTRKPLDQVDDAELLVPPPNFIQRKTYAGHDTQKREASNGSALEALGALLLQRDSSGKVSKLSFTKHRDNIHKSRQGLSKVSSAWLQGVKEAGAARLGIRMPRHGDGGQTIAQRRARKQGYLFKSFIDRIGVGVETEIEDEYVRVGTTIWQPTYEVGKTKQSKGQSVVTELPEIVPNLILSQLSTSTSTNGQRTARDTSIFGVGSAFALNDPPDAPPSPIAMPGAWSIGGPGWNSKSGDWREEGALLLPPPLLDDQGSDAKSFEGLLGIRRMREQERARKQIEKLKARNRPAHKVGMLTAFSNFVKAAHAADKASKAGNMTSRPSDMLSRRHTEPIHISAIVEDADDTTTGTEGGNANTEESDFDEPQDVHHTFQGHGMDRSSSSRRRSLEGASRSLDTVYENQASNEEDWSHIRTHGNRASSITSSSARSSIYEFTAPTAPRLLPILMTITSPNTPLAPDPDYDLEKRKDPSAPPTPRLGPTLLSLPPSLWVQSGLEEQRNLFSMHLTMAHTQGPPGTPRLAPTLLEIAPSPFPMSPSFSPLSKPSRDYGNSTFGDGSSTPAEVTSPFSLSPIRSPTMSAMSPASASHTRARRGKEHKSMNGPNNKQSRMTPSSMISASGKRSSIEFQNNFNNGDRTVKSESKGLESDDPSTKRSFLLWFLFGDLGLNSRLTIAAKITNSPLPAGSSFYSRNYGVFLGFLAHLYGFTIFIMAHMVDLSYRIFEFLSMTFWFLRWMALNLTGQTILARCIIDAYGLVQKEWQTVSQEDHEGKGKKNDSKNTAQGLSRWQVVKGLIELVCLQDVTRDRYMKEGAGLEELTGWQSTKSRKNKERKSSMEWVDLGAKREADRTALNEDEEDQDSSSEDELDSDDDMVVTRQGPEILEFTKTPKIEPKSYFSLHSEDGSFHGTKKKSAESIEHNRVLVKTVRWASRLAISAYGLHVTLVDLPATFTPSGNRFSRQAFAHLSRLHHEDVLHADIQTLDSEAYSPTFYLVRDLSRKVVVVSVRGTQSLQDIIVDLEMVVDEVKLSDGEGDAEKLYCHAGVLRAAKALISRESTLFKTLSEALEENQDFGIVFTGHSLGGAIASAVVLLLSKYIDQGQSIGEQGRWVTHDNSGLPVGRTIRAITFAHPATVNASLANRAGKGKIPLVLSIVLGSDIIPRCGHGQARELRRVLGGLSRVRKRKGDLFHQHKIDEDHRVHIVTSWWRWKSIKRKGETASKDDVKLARRIEDDLWTLRCDVENDLYAAVKQRSLQSPKQKGELNGKENNEDGQLNRRRVIPPSPWFGPAQRAKAPLHQLAARRQALDAVTLQNEEAISPSGILVPAGQSILVYKNELYRITSPLSFFSLPDFHVSTQSYFFLDLNPDPIYLYPTSHACLQNTFPLPTKRLCWRTSNYNLPRGTHNLMYQHQQSLFLSIVIA